MLRAWPEASARSCIKPTIRGSFNEELQVREEATLAWNVTEGWNGNKLLTTERVGYSNGQLQYTGDEVLYSRLTESEEQRKLYVRSAPCLLHDVSAACQPASVVQPY